VSRIYEITYAANRDIDAILSRLSMVAGLDSTEKFLGQLNSKLKKIAAFPFIGTARPEWGENHRSLPIESYIIVYRVTDNLVEIIRVMSGYQNLDEFFVEESSP
jgi:toxin ParE1/3/4